MRFASLSFLPLWREPEFQEGREQLMTATVSLYRAFDKHNRQSLGILLNPQLTMPLLSSQCWQTAWPHHVAQCTQCPVLAEAPKDSTATLESLGRNR